MLKKSISLVMAIVFIAAMLTSCGMVNDVVDQAKNALKSSEPADTEKPEETETPQDSEKPAATENAVVANPQTPSESFAKYAELKGKAFERITAKMEANTDLALYSLTFLPISLIDLTLIPITVLTADSEASAAALAMLGMADIKVEESGGKYTITYKDKDEKKLVQTCEYDKGTDSLKTWITDEAGKETIYFEYVKIGCGYAAQYYALDEENGSQIMTTFFDDSGVAAFGIQKTENKPASIYKNGSMNVDIVKGGDTYMILDGDKITVHDNGEDKTY